MSSSFARMYDAECGEFLASETKKFITQTLRGVHTSYENHGYHPNDATFWSGGSYGQGTFRCDCSSCVYYMYYKFHHQPYWFQMLLKGYNRIVQGHL